MTGDGSLYYRPVVQSGLIRSTEAVALAGGPLWFDQIEILSRTAPAALSPVANCPADVLAELSRPRAAIAGLAMDTPQIMGIVNVTPDSFSDGGVHENPDVAVASGLEMVRDGATLLDIGGESTRPGAVFVPPEVEVARVEPVIAGLRAKTDTTISVDTRKTAVAQAAVGAGATLVNDVSGFTFDAGLAAYCAAAQVPVCVMHSQGDPETMQNNPTYDDVLLDVFDYLKSRIDALIATGIPKTQIIADPGIGFGKTLDHNLLLLNRISLFHGLGVPILLGASRKKFIGTIGRAEPADRRAPGSVAVALAAIAQGVQIVRVHDVAETAQALRLWQAVHKGGFDG